MPIQPSGLAGLSIGRRTRPAGAGKRPHASHRLAADRSSYLIWLKGFRFRGDQTHRPILGWSSDSHKWQIRRGPRGSVPESPTRRGGLPRAGMGTIAGSAAALRSPDETWESPTGRDGHDHWLRSGPKPLHFQISACCSKMATFPRCRLTRISGDTCLKDLSSPPADTRRPRAATRNSGTQNQRTQLEP